MTDVIIRMYFKDIRKAIKIIGLFIFEADPSFAYHSPEHLTNSLHETFMAPGQETIKCPYPIHKIDHQLKPFYN